MRQIHLVIVADRNKGKKTKIRRAAFLAMMSIQYGLGRRQDTHHIYYNRQSPSLNVEVNMQKCLVIAYYFRRAVYLLEGPFTLDEVCVCVVLKLCNFPKNHNLTVIARCIHKCENGESSKCSASSFLYIPTSDTASIGKRPCFHTRRC